jgi:hypothetical protein
MGDNVDTTAVDTAVDTNSDAAADTSTVLTAADTSTAVDTNSDVAAAADDTTAATDESPGDGDAGPEGSDTPPDTYADFVLPEGMVINEAALADANPLFKELGLNQEQAQKVIDLYAQQAQAGSQKQVDDFNQLMSDWSTASKNDGEFGGDKFDENIKVARNAVDKYGTPELKQLLEDHGVGNHPEVVRFMVRVGQTLKEDNPGDAGNVSVQKKDRVDVLYPSSNK